MSKLISGYKVYRILPSGMLGNPMYLPHHGLLFKPGLVVAISEHQLSPHPSRPPSYPTGVHFYLNLHDARANLEKWRKHWFYGPAAIIKIEGPSDTQIEENGVVCISPWIRLLEIAETSPETRDGNTFAL